MDYEIRKKSREANITELLNAYKAKMLKYNVARQTPYYWHFLYAEEARNSFHNGYYVSCILTASALVECILFWEYLRRNPNRQKAGSPLHQSRDSLAEYLQNLVGKGVPLKSLLYKSELKEKNSSFSKPSEIVFVKLRNIFAHGDLVNPIRNPPLFYPPTNEAYEYGIEKEEYFDNHPKKGLENIAYIQLVKGLNFAIEFSEYLGNKKNS